MLFSWLCERVVLLPGEGLRGSEDQVGISSKLCNATLQSMSVLETDTKASQITQKYQEVHEQEQKGVEGAKHRKHIARRHL